MFVYCDSVIDSALFFLDERFGAFNEAPLIYFKIFNFCTWPEQGPPAEYGNSSVSKLLLHFQKVLDQDPDSALGEWPVLKQYLLQRRKHCTGKLRSFSDVYVTLLIEQPEDVGNILVLVEIMVVISPSTAGCERSFHLVNLVKNKLRTRLRNDTLNILLKIAESGASIDDFDPNPVIDLWLKLSNTGNKEDLRMWNVQVPNIISVQNNEK